MEETYTVSFASARMFMALICASLTGSMPTSPLTRTRHIVPDRLCTVPSAFCPTLNVSSGSCVTARCETQKARLTLSTDSTRTLTSSPHSGACPGKTSSRGIER